MALVTLTATITACPDPPKVGDFTLSLTPASTNLVQNSTLNVGVNINRLNSFAEAVNVTLISPPTGLTASPLTIDGTSLSGTLVMQANSSVTPGAVKLTVSALGGGLGLVPDHRMGFLRDGGGGCGESR